MSEKVTFPDQVFHRNETSTFINQIDEKRMESFLTKLSSFQTRYFKSASGEKSAQWIIDQITELSSLSLS